MRNTIPDVSIIIPVYNAGKYLIKCLDTLVNQTIKNIEIILVLDCPTDGSDEICRTYASEHNNIKLIENAENQHIGKSRNIGLSIAKGKYVAFSDHDDYRENNMFEKLFARAEENQAEIVFGAPVMIKNNKIIQNQAFEIHQEYTVQFLLHDLLSGGDSLTTTPIVTNIHPNLYLRSFLLLHDIKFPDTKTTTPEDRIFQIECLIKSNRIAFQHDILYYHVIHEQSTGHQSSYLSGKTRSEGKLLIYNILNKENVWQQFQYSFYVGTKKELTNCLIDDFWQQKNMLNLLTTMQMYKKNEVFRTSFLNGKYNIDHFRFGGRMFRKLIWWFMLN